MHIGGTFFIVVFKTFQQPFDVKNLYFYQRKTILMKASSPILLFPFPLILLVSGKQGEGEMAMMETLILEI